MLAVGTKSEMAPKKQNFDRKRAEFVAEPSLIEAATRAAESIGLGLSAFIRVAITEKINRMKAEGYKPPKRPKPRSANDN